MAWGQRGQGFVPGQKLPPEPAYYLLPEAAALLRLNKATLYRWARIGEIKLVKAGFRTVIHRDELQRLLTPPEGQP